MSRQDKLMRILRGVEMATVMGMINGVVLVVSSIVGVSVGIILFVWAAGGAEDNPQTVALGFIVCVIIAIYSGANLIALYLADHK